MLCALRKKRSSCLDVKKLIYSRRQNILKGHVDGQKREEKGEKTKER